MEALILVDIQNDFLLGGALAVKDGNQIIPLVNSLQQKFDLIIATQDWHPKDHGSFAGNHNKQVGEKIKLSGIDQVLWPAHCVQGTPGADFAPELNIGKINKVFRKGTDKTIDSYSGFFDNNRKKSTGLESYLKEKEVTEVYIVGLATDYCVKFTALDAVSLGFKTAVILSACRGVNLKPGDVQAAIAEMKRKGVKIIKEENKN